MEWVFMRNVLQSFLQNWPYLTSNAHSTHRLRYEAAKRFWYVVHLLEKVLKVEEYCICITLKGENITSTWSPKECRQLPSSTFERVVCISLGGAGGGLGATAPLVWQKPILFEKEEWFLRSNQDMMWLNPLFPLTKKESV